MKTTIGTSSKRAPFYNLGLVLLLAAATMVLVGCSPDGGETGPISTPTGTGRVEPTATLTPIPTPTETPLPPQALFITPAESDQELISELETTLAELAAASGLALKRLPELKPEDLTPNTQIVVALPTVSDLGTLAISRPNISFIAIADPDLQPSANLSIIGPQGFRADQQGFIAGNLAAMQTEDWRVGVVSVGDAIDGQAARQGFLNGAIFFCGLCRAAFPPFVLYPTFSDVPTGADEAAWQAAADALLGEAVQTVYLYPGADNPGLRQILVDRGFILITGSGGQPGVQPNVIARIVPDPASALKVIWPEMLNGNPGQVVPMPLGVRDAHPELLSAGRQGLLEELITDLQEGIVDTGIDPLTAESR